MLEEPIVRCQIDHHPHSVSHSRHVLSEVLRDRGLLTDDVLLATNELVTNVVRHTDNGGELRVWDPGPAAPLRVEVEDTDPRIPVIAAQPHGYGGHGLFIVQAVCALWGVDPLHAGKIVWAEFNRSRLLNVTTPHLPAAYE